MKLTRAAGRKAILLLGLFACSVLPAAAADFGHTEARTPDDLYLADEAVDQSEALSHYAWGLFLLMREQSRTEQVQMHMLEALRHLPESRHLLEQAAAPWLAKDDYEGIIENLSPLAKDHPAAIHLQLLVATAYQETDQTEKAIELIEDAYRHKDIREPRLMRELASLYWRTREYKKLKKLLAQARRDPEMHGQFITYYALAVFHSSMAADPEGIDLTDRQQARHKTRALDFAAEAADLLDSSVTISDIGNLAGVFEVHEKRRAAIKLLRKAQRIHPARKPALNIRIAKNLKHIDEPRQARKLLYSIDIKEQDDPQILLRLGRAFLDHDELSGAVRCYKRVMIMAPNASSVRLTLGYLYLQHNAPRKAINLFQGGDDRAPQTQVLISRAYAQMRDWQKAEEWLNRAARKAGESGNENFFNIDYYLYRATLEEESGRTDDSIETARKALEQEPDNPVVTNFIGYIMADHGKELEEAESLIKLAVSQDPENAAYLDSLAWVYFRQDRYQEALAEISKVLRQPDVPDDPVILDHAGDIYAANGFSIMAARYWWGALRHDPANAEEIRRKLRR